MLTNDLDMVEAELDFRVDWWRGMSADAQRALANMCFNLGWPRLSGFKKMLSALAAHDYNEAADQALDSRWAQQVGARAVRVTELMRSA